MPITLSAQKKMRQDKKRRLTNLRTITKLKGILVKSRKKPSADNLQAAYSVIDRAAKKKVIHKNKASRLKSRLAKKKIAEKPLVKSVKKKRVKAVSS